MFALLAGLGILTVALFPLALPGLLLFVVAPLLLALAVGALLALPLVLPLWLGRSVVRLRSRRRELLAAGYASAARDAHDGWRPKNSAIPSATGSGRWICNR